MDLKNKTALILYEYSGVFTNLYKELGYNTIQVDKEFGQDVRLLEYDPVLNVECILAFPPCTYFAVSGNKYRDKEKAIKSDKDFQSLYEENIQEGLSCVDVVFRLIHLHRPKYWMIENPIGTLQRYIGKSKHIFSPFEYAGYLDNPENEAYTKKTCLWGDFTMPDKKPVEPIKGSLMHTNIRDPKKRSLSPSGFAKAFVIANTGGQNAQRLLFS